MDQGTPFVSSKEHELRFDTTCRRPTPFVPAATIRPRFNGRAPATLCHSELRLACWWSRLREEERLRYERLTSEYSLSLTAPGRASAVWNDALVRRVIGRK